MVVVCNQLHGLGHRALQRFDERAVPADDHHPFVTQQSEIIPEA
jgi:hypothetical protein